MFSPTNSGLQLPCPKYLVNYECATAVPPASVRSYENGDDTGLYFGEF